MSTTVDVRPSRLDRLIADCEALRPALLRASSRSEALRRQAEHCHARSRAIRTTSKPRTVYARLEGSLEGLPTIAFVRKDGSVISASPYGERLTQRHPAPEVPFEPDADGVPANDAVGFGFDPLVSTLGVARTFDQMFSLELLCAADRGTMEILATGSFDAPSNAPFDLDTQPFFVDVTDMDDTHVVRLVGELDIASADELQKTLVKVAGSSIVVDLAALRFIDAAGLSALMAARRDITAQGHRFSLTGASGMVRRVFDITDLSHFLDS